MTGLWLGQKGETQLSFTVVPKRGGLAVSNIVTACREVAFRYGLLWRHPRFPLTWLNGRWAARRARR